MRLWVVVIVAVVTMVVVVVEWLVVEWISWLVGCGWG